MPAPSSPGLYVHIPFCSIKCFYCDFAAFAGQKAVVGRYLAALEREAAWQAGRVPTTLYVGGGTPSELEAAQIRQLFALVGRAFPGARLEESTFEANPESVSEEKLRALADAGVSRLSLGLQTADDELLAAVGRKHTFQQFVDVYRRARRAGPWAISVDLMYGLPGQSLRQCLDSVDAVLALEPEHASLYGLQVEDRTLFGRRGVEPDEGLGRDMFEKSLDRLAAAGFHHYEISNFARPGFESLHNLNYWRCGEYVGLGCGAASHLDGERWSNVDRLAAYCEAVEAGRRPSVAGERLEGRRKLGERAFIGLRLIDGFAPSPELETTFAPQWTRLLRRGLVERRQERYALTREGVFLANEAFAEFVAPFHA